MYIVHVQFFRSNLELNDQKTKEICQLEKKVLLFEADELRRTNDELKQNQSVTVKAELQCREVKTVLTKNISQFKHFV